MRLSVPLLAMFILLLGLAGPAPIAPAETLRLTLEEAIQLGLKNASSIQSRALEVGKAREQVASARAGYTPGLTASGSWMHLFEAPEATLGRYLSPQDPLSVSLDLSQLVYSFGRVRTGVKLAEAGVEAAQLQLQEEQRSLSTRIQRAFYGYLLAEAALVIQRQTLEAREETYQVAQRKYQAGVASDYEVLQAQAQVESFRPTLIAAENQLKLAQVTVRTLLALPEGEQVEVVLVGSLEPPQEGALALERQRLIEQALQTRSELRGLRQGLAAAALQEELARAATRPSFAGVLSYRATSGVDPLSGENRWWGEDSWNGTLSGGISVNVPLAAMFPWSAAQADRRESRLSAQQLERDLEGLEGSIRMAVEQALLSMEERRQQIRAGETSIRLAERLYESARMQYERGYISSLELRDAQLGLSAARLAQLQSMYGYRQALIDLQDAVGVDRLLNEET